MAVVDYESIQIPEGYLNMRINRYKRKYVIDYLQEYGTYPSIEDIVNIPIPDEVMTHIKQSYYVNYLINEADKSDDYNNESMIQYLYGCWELNKINGDDAGFGKAKFMYIRFDSTNKYFVYNETYPQGNFGSYEYVKYGNNYLLESRGETILGGYNYTVSLVDNTLILTRTDDLSKVLEFNKIETLTNYYPDIVGTHQYTYNNINYVVSFFEDNTCDVYYSKNDIDWDVINDNHYYIFYGDFGFEKTYILTDNTLEPKFSKIQYDNGNIVLTTSNNETIILTKIETVPEYIIFSVLHSPLGKSWIELPNMDDDSLEYYSHSFEYNNKIYHNYSFGWSQNDRISKWVAYPLDSTYMKHNVDRTNAWAIDPLLGEEKSSAPFAGYAGDFDRDMLIPSASRLCCEIANEQVFYGSNVFPGVPGHTWIWTTVQDRIRIVAKNSDCTYVLKGLITSENSIIETDSNGNNVTVPDAIYAVILRQSRGLDFGEWNACAYYTENKDYGSDYDLQSVMMSVSDLESITGMEYFVALKDVVGLEKYNQIKSTVNEEIFLW